MTFISSLLIHKHVFFAESPATPAEPASPAEPEESDVEDDEGDESSGDEGGKTLGPQTTNGDKCHFPYKHKNETYETCTHVDHASPW